MRLPEIWKELSAGLDDLKLPRIYSINGSFKKPIETRYDPKISRDPLSIIIRKIGKVIKDYSAPVGIAVEEYPLEIIKPLLDYESLEQEESGFWWYLSDNRRGAYAEHTQIFWKDAKILHLEIITANGTQMKVIVIVSLNAIYYHNLTEEVVEQAKKNRERFEQSIKTAVEVHRYNLRNPFSGGLPGQNS